MKISLSTDGGQTYPYVLGGEHANDGSEVVTLPNVGTTHARVKVEAVGNIFFDISNANFTITAVGGPVTGKVWLGLKNSDDVGTRFDVKAEVLKNGVRRRDGCRSTMCRAAAAASTTRSSGRSPSPFPRIPSSITTGDTLGLPAVRADHRRRAATAAVRRGSRSTTAPRTASSSSFSTEHRPAYYLRDGFVLGRDTVTGGSRKTIDVFVDRAKNGNPFVSFGTWSKTF